MIRVHDLVPSFEDVTTLTRHPGNPNEGDVEAIAGSIDINGLYAPIVVQRSTRFILKGNHTFEALLALGETEVPVVWVDIDDEAATRLMLADNGIAAKASRNPDMLVALLAQLAESERGLMGTGYEEKDMVALLGDDHSLAEILDNDPLLRGPKAVTVVGYMDGDDFTPGDIPDVLIRLEDLGYRAVAS